jgi:hypothetical protein
VDTGCHRTVGLPLDQKCLYAVIIDGCLGRVIQASLSLEIPASFDAPGGRSRRSLSPWLPGA